MTMRCRLCGGVVVWVGSLMNPSGTQCTQCGEKNCHIIEEPDDNEPDDEPEED